MKVYLITKKELRKFLREYVDELEDRGDISTRIPDIDVHDDIDYWLKRIKKKSLL